MTQLAGVRSGALRPEPEEGSAVRGVAVRSACDAVMPCWWLERGAGALARVLEALLRERFVAGVLVPVRGPLRGRRRCVFTRLGGASRAQNGCVDPGLVRALREAAAPAPRES